MKKNGKKNTMKRAAILVYLLMFLFVQSIPTGVFAVEAVTVSAVEATEATKATEDTEAARGSGRFVEVDSLSALEYALDDWEQRIRLTGDITPMSNVDLAVWRELELDLNGYDLGSTYYKINILANGKGLTVSDSSGDQGNCYADLYGGREGGSGIINPKLTIRGGRIIGNVYGGNKSRPSSSTQVEIQGGILMGNVYGGNRQDAAGKTKVIFSGGEIRGGVFGGGFNSSAPVTGTREIVFRNCGSVSQPYEVKFLSGADRVLLDSAIVSVTGEEGGNPFGTGAEEVRELEVPPGSTLVLPQGGEVSGDWIGGGWLELADEALHIGGTASGETSVELTPTVVSEGAAYLVVEGAAGVTDQAFHIPYEDWKFQVERSGNSATWKLGGTHYTVTFDSMGGEGAFGSQTILSGGLAFCPENQPHREDGDFLGWFSTSASALQTETFNFQTPILKDLTLFAGWKFHEGPPVPDPPPADGDDGHSGGHKTRYLVSFDAGDHGKIAGDQSRWNLVKGSHISVIPEVEAEPGYVFLGWSLDGALPVDPAEVTVNDSFTFLALYEKNTPEETTPPAMGKVEPPEEPAALPEDPALLHQPYAHGYEDGSFRPDQPIRRAETATLLASLDPEYVPDRFDEAERWEVEEDRWYSDAVSYSIMRELITPKGQGFVPDSTVTRAEFCAILGRFLGLRNKGTAGYQDTSGNWAEGYISQMSQKGYLTGYWDGSFRPGLAISRAEVIAAINRSLGRAPDPRQMDGSLYRYRIQMRDVTPRHWAFYEIMEAVQVHAIVDFHNTAEKK